MTPNHRNGIAFYISLFLGLLFLVSSLGKLVDIPGFAVSVSDYHLLPEALVMPFAFVLSWLEFLCGMALLFRFKLRMTGLIVSSMLLMFAIAIATAVARGLSIDCGCFPIPLLGSSKTGWFALLRTSLFLALAVELVVLARGIESE